MLPKCVYCISVYPSMCNSKKIEVIFMQGNVRPGTVVALKPERRPVTHTHTHTYIYIMIMIYNEGGISCILKKFIPNITALKSKDLLVIKNGPNNTITPF